MSMTPDQRAAHCRAIGHLGGRATVTRHGTAHMSAIGKLGFAAAMQSVGGHVLAGKLDHSYQQKFGHPIERTIDSAEYKRKQKIRRQARKANPDLACVTCGAERAQVHHINGLDADDPNDPSNIEGRCPNHHRKWHREQYRERRRRKRP